jgi:hypothetical protein
MEARPGDWLIVEGTTLNHHRREGLITKIRKVDGSPPYFVRWLDTDHLTLVFPGPDAHVETTEQRWAARQAEHHVR